MNIEQIKTTGIVDTWVDFTGRITEVKEQKMRGGEGKKRMMTKVFATDTSGKIGVWLESTANLGDTFTLSGMLKEYKDVRYVDYCKIKYTHPPQTGSEVPQDAPQAPQNAPESTNSQQPALQSTSKSKNEFEARCTAGIVAGNVVAAWITKDAIDVNGKLLEITDLMAMFFLSGKVADNDDIGF